MSSQSKNQPDAFDELRHNQINYDPGRNTFWRYEGSALRDVLDRLIIDAHNHVARGDSFDFVLRRIDQAEAEAREALSNRKKPRSAEGHDAK